MHYQANPTTKVKNMRRRTGGAVLAYDMPFGYDFMQS